MAKQPFMPLFFGNFLAATADWGGEERGLYLLLLAHAWELGSIPAEPARIRRMVGYDQESFAAAWPVVSTKFIPRDGRLVNDRLEAHRAKASEITAKRAELGRIGGLKTQAKRKQLLESDEAIASKNGSPASSFAQASNPIQSNLNPKTSSPDISSHQNRGSTPRSAPAAPTKRPKATKARTTIPPDLEPSDADREFAHTRLPDMHVPLTWTNFRDHHLARGTLMADWHACWRTWVQNCMKGFEYVRRVRQPMETPGPGTFTPAQWRERQAAKAASG